jgi:hypothetical protein
MTDLQMGLIGLGGIAVAGVLAYNKWQEHKHRKLAEQLLGVRQADVLLDEKGSAASAAESRTASSTGDGGDSGGGFRPSRYCGARRAAAAPRATQRGWLRTATTLCLQAAAMVAAGWRDGARASPRRRSACFRRRSITSPRSNSPNDCRLPDP